MIFTTAVYTIAMKETKQSESKQKIPKIERSINLIFKFLN